MRRAGAKVDRKTAEVSYGFAKYLRDALPNASFIGFTCTPIEKTDVNTPAVFGEYIDVYYISRAVEDGATERVVNRELEGPSPRQVEHQWELRGGPQLSHSALLTWYNRL